jgi:hypothetical protein
MANLMVIRVDDEGEAVLIVTHQDGVTPMGFATQMTFEDFLEHRSQSKDACRSSNGISNPSRGFWKANPASKSTLIPPSHALRSTPSIWRAAVFPGSFDRRNSRLPHCAGPDVIRR